MVQRLTYRRRHSYRTRANRVKPVKTPGGVLKLQYVKKKGGSPKCGDCGDKLRGIPTLRRTEGSRLSKRQKTVRRSYGGSRCHKCVRNRIVRSFLIEEQRLVKAMVMKQEAKAKKVEKDEKIKERRKTHAKGGKK